MKTLAILFQDPLQRDLWLVSKSLDFWERWDYQKKRTTKKGSLVIITQRAVSSRNDRIC